MTAVVRVSLSISLQFSCACTSFLTGDNSGFETCLSSPVVDDVTFTVSSDIFLSDDDRLRSNGTHGVVIGKANENSAKNIRFKSLVVKFCH